MQPKVDEVEELKTLVSQANSYWLHFHNHYYTTQTSTVKTYLWLAVTLLGAQFYVLDNFVFKAAQEYKGLIFTFFAVSALTAFLAMVIGVSCMSMIFFGHHMAHPPYIQAGYQVDALYSSENLRHSRIMILRGICDDYDRGISELQVMINKKGIRMRIQGVCILLSIIRLLLFFLTLFFLGGLCQKIIHNRNNKSQRLRLTLKTQCRTGQIYFISV